MCTTEQEKGGRDDTEQCIHLKQLLRACFMIGFTYDCRIRRFVMSRHKYHYVTFKTRPPDPHTTDGFVQQCRELFIAPFLSIFNGDDNDDNCFDKVSAVEMNDMDLMIQSCIKLWIREYLLKTTPSSFSSLSSSSSTSVF
jgi:hypothetical protein